MNKLWWEVLKVDKSANNVDVKSAYKKWIRIYHPDQYENMPEEVRIFHEECLKEINVAYDEYQRSQQIVKDNEPFYEQPSSNDASENQKADIKEQIIFKVFLTVAKKYGAVGVERAIMGYISTNRLTCITRDENARKLIDEYISSQDLKDYITQKFPANDLLESTRLFISTLGIDKIAYLETACMKTYSRFQESHGQGFEAIKGALGKSLYGTFIGFTNNANARTNLQQNVKADEIMNLIHTHLLNLGYDMQNVSIENYAEMIRNKVLEQEYGKAI